MEISSIHEKIEKQLHVEYFVKQKLLWRYYTEEDNKVLRQLCAELQTKLKEFKTKFEKNEKGHNKKADKKNRHIRLLSAWFENTKKIFRIQRLQRCIYEVRCSRKQRSCKNCFQCNSKAGL